MCGITGIINSEGNINSAAYIQEMTDALRHRGPDDEGFACFQSAGQDVRVYGGKDTPRNVYDANLVYTPSVPFSDQEHDTVLLALGHRRLSIIDLSPGGHQPMCTSNRRYWIVYNGEIYNYLELKEELLKEGYSFSSRSDTEVLLTAYVHWGEDVLKRLVGMFAFAIYDRQEESLFLARDFFGIKPLYYTIWPGGFAFASEIKALILLPHIRRKANPQRVYEYLRFGFIDHGAETLISEIKQLPAAHYTRTALDKKHSPRPVRYWDIDITANSGLSFDAAARKIKDLFVKNVALHLRSDVPIGAALSGGIDSSSIVMSMRKVQTRSLDLNTFSFIAENSVVNEEKWVDLIGKEAGATVHKVKISPDELLSDLDNLIYCQDEPFGGTSIYAQYRVMRLAKEKGIKVMLDGQGADEMLGGYRPYLAAKLGSLVRKFEWLKACQLLLKIRRYDDYTLRSILIQTGAYFLPLSLQAFARMLVGKDFVPPWLERKWFVEREVTVAYKEKNLTGDILREELYRSLMEQLLILLLRYEDRNSMAFSIESRVPFLTPDLASFILSLPEDYIINVQGRSKSIFRKAMRGIVPDAILDRSDKIGFATPEKRWLKHLRPWVETVLHSDAAKRIVFLNTAAMERVWQDVFHGRKEFDFTVWRWINFIRWAEQHDISFEF
jgi:asparagine synthase (glutamine-hydrolysing)